MLPAFIFYKKEAIIYHLKESKGNYPAQQPKVHRHISSRPASGK